MEGGPGPFDHRTTGIPAMTDEECRLFSGFVSDRFGLNVFEAQRDRVRFRLKERLEARAMTSFLEYYRFLVLSPRASEELPFLVEALTNNETYFLRERYQLDWYFGEVLPSQVRERPPGEPVRVLSAGCSSGEEAYSLAIVHHENQFRCLGRPLEIHAIDLNPSRIRQAEVAEYEGHSFRAASPEAKERYFAATATNGRLRLKSWLKAPVRFRVLNLMELSSAFPEGYFDAVFCRNVLIYFSESTMQRACALFHRVLSRGSPLFLGHSESLLGRTRLFRPQRATDFIYYTKAVA
ncbi:MAG: methyltransferase domain-containing protein [Holophagales bacterium]|nr:methyltransferase domain-containing protein [Holophagales bacterium]